jgi:ACS family hexuronate transporter-like MFS transporter
LVSSPTVSDRETLSLILTGWSIAGIATPLASWPEIASAFGDPSQPGLGEFRWLFICRTVLGFCEAGHWPCALLTARNILSDDQRPLGNSILQSGASLGAILTPLVIQGIRATGLPWQAPFFIIGIIGLLWVPLWIVLIRTGDLTYRRPVTKASIGSASPSFFVVQLATLTVIVVTISLAWQFQRAWLPKYLKEFHLYSEDTANYFTSGYYIVADIGCLFFAPKRADCSADQRAMGALISFSGCVLLFRFRRSCR